MKKRFEARIYGRVQMVMFRDFAERNARKLGLAGFVRNETDGGVLVVAEGEETMLKQLLSKISQGPMFARVEEVELEWKDTTGEFSGFTIRYD